jgi:hypothetical protein
MSAPTPSWSVCLCVFNRLLADLSAKYGLPSESILEHSIRSLAHVPIDAHNIFVECRNVLGLREGPVAKTDPDAGDEK